MKRANGSQVGFLNYVFRIRLVPQQPSRQIVGGIQVPDQVCYPSRNSFGFIRRCAASYSFIRWHDSNPSFPDFKLLSVCSPDAREQ